MRSSPPRLASAFLHHSLPIISSRPHDGSVRTATMSLVPSISPDSVPPLATAEHTLRRGAIACRRCRRARSKCINEGGKPPCRSCELAGKGDDCEFIKGNSVIDRKDPPRKSRHIDDSNQVDDDSMTASPSSRKPHPRKRPRTSLSHTQPQSRSPAQQGASPAYSSPFQDGSSDTHLQHGFSPIADANSSGYSALGESFAEGSGDGAMRERALPDPAEMVEGSTPNGGGEGGEGEEIGELSGIIWEGDSGAGISEKAETYREETNAGVYSVWPTQAELEEGVEIYFSSFYQVGFLHKSSFTSKIKSSSQSISTFLIYSLLSLVSGTSPLIIARFGTPQLARSTYKSLSMSMIPSVCCSPSLEVIQGFYLLALSDWGEGTGARSWMFIGMGLRMCELLKLDRGETYKGVGLGSSDEEQITAESSRRTVWSLLIADDSLVVGDGFSSTSKLDITIPLPCEEDDFEFISIPTTSQISRESASRSLMGNTVSAMSLWCRAARRAAGIGIGPGGGGELLMGKDVPTPPWVQGKGEYAEVNANLERFLSELSPRLRFSPATLTAHRNRQTDMALCHLHLIYHSTHLVLRRIYLPTFLAVLDPSIYPLPTTGSIPNIPPPPGFWKDCSQTTFQSAFAVINIAKQYSEGREHSKGKTVGLSKGFTPLMALYIFTAGMMTSYLWRWNYLSPELAPEAESRTMDAINLIASLVPEMQMAKRWLVVLRQAYHVAKHPHHPQQYHSEGVPSAVPHIADGAEEALLVGSNQINPLGALAELAVSLPLNNTKQDGPVRHTPQQQPMDVTSFDPISHSGNGNGTNAFDGLDFYNADFGLSFPFLQNGNGLI